jgi:hypothetical protein
VLMDRTRLGQIAYIGDVTWLECPKNEDGFLAFIDEVLAVLESPQPPPAGEKCFYCKYRDDARGHGM